MMDFGVKSHSNVNLRATGRALLLQNQSTSYGMIGGLQLNDTSNANALAAELLAMVFCLNRNRVINFIADLASKDINQHSFKKSPNFCIYQKP